MYAILDFVGDNYFPIIDKIAEELKVHPGLIYSRQCRDARRSSAFIACAPGCSICAMRSRR